MNPKNKFERPVWRSAWVVELFYSDLCDSFDEFGPRELRIVSCLLGAPAEFSSEQEAEYEILKFVEEKGPPIPSFVGYAIRKVCQVEYVPKSEGEQT